MERTGTETAVAVEIPILHRDLQKDIRLVFRMEETAADPAAAQAVAVMERWAVDATTEHLQKRNCKFKNCS